MKLLQKIFLLSSAGFILSCASTNQCPEKPAPGNLGSNVNSTADDYSPFIGKHSGMYFTSTRQTKETSDETIFLSAMAEGFFSAPRVVTTPPVNTMPQSGSASIFVNPFTNVQEVFFAATNPSSARPNVDIYVTALQDGKWTVAKNPGANINSDAWDSQPAISPDGSFLIFSSDRAGGTGGADLYISYRNPDGSWAPAQNLGTGINTVSDERTPHITPEKNLFFASRGYFEGGGFEIMKAKFLSVGKWEKPEILPAPINSDADEISPFVLADTIFIASNREGGCGGYDLYSFLLCGPVAIHGKISSAFPVKLAGVVEAMNENGQQVARIPTDSDGNFELTLPGNKNFSLNYTSSCLKNISLNQDLATPCSEFTALAMDVSFEMPKDYPIFSFENYDIPFFVTGYHLPNTTRNLDALRLLFSYNLLGTTDSTKYIQFPTPEYDAFAEKVDLALEEATNFILEKLEYLNSACSTGSEEIEVTVEGYADPRDFTPKAKYMGDEIADAEYGISVQRGATMNNTLLSQLRAYSTAKTLQEKLEENSSYTEIKDRVRWNIRGKGIDDSAALPYERKRRVSLRIGFAG